MLRGLMTRAAFTAGRAAADAGPTGPECSEPLRSAVLAALEGRTDIHPGQIIQYLQVIKVDGRYTVQLCTVTVPVEPQP